MYLTHRAFQNARRLRRAVFCRLPPGRHPANRSGRPSVDPQGSRRRAHAEQKWNMLRRPAANSGRAGDVTRALVERLGVESAKTAFPAWRIRSFPYPSKENSVHLNTACIPKPYEQRKRLARCGAEGSSKNSRGSDAPLGCHAPGRRWSRRPERSRGDGQASRDRSTLRSSIAGRDLLAPVRLGLAGRARPGSRCPASGMPRSRSRSSPVRSPDSQRQRAIGPELVVDVLVTRQKAEQPLRNQLLYRVAFLASVVIRLAASGRAARRPGATAARRRRR